MSDEVVWIVRFGVIRPTAIYRVYYLEVELVQHTALGTPAQAVLLAMQYLAEAGFDLDKLREAKARLASEAWS